MQTSCLHYYFYIVLNSYVTQAIFFLQTFREPVSDYQVVREKAATQRRDVERALTRFMAKTGATQSLFKDDITAFPCESFCQLWLEVAEFRKYEACWIHVHSNHCGCDDSDRSTAQCHPISQRSPALRAGTAGTGGDGLFRAGRPDRQ